MRLTTDFTCPECEKTTYPLLKDLECGQYTCPVCDAVHHFDKASATKMRGEMEDSLTDLIDIFKRLGK